MTLIEYVNRAGARLDEAGVSFGHGTTNAFDEAVWLVLWCLRLPLEGEDDVAQRTAMLFTVVSLASQNLRDGDCRIAKRALQVFAAASWRLRSREGGRRELQ